MVPARPQSVNLAIGHVTQRRKRMPQTGVAVSEQPLESIERQSGADMRVFVNVAVIVEVDKVVTERLPEHDPDDCR